MQLFNPLRIGSIQLPNRIVFMPTASGLARQDGAVSAELAAFYAARAAGGAGMIVLEAGWPLAPAAVGAAHIGLYHDALMPALAGCAKHIQRNGSRAFIRVDQPVAIDALTDETLHAIGRSWVAAAQRACDAGFDGVMLSCVDGGMFQRLLSPLTNQRSGLFGGSLEQRTRLLLETIERMAARLGSHPVIGLRLLADEFTPGGVTLQDARVVARRLTGAGVQLLEVYAPSSGAAPMAQFPGWRAPLAAAIRTLVDVPIIVGDVNDDANFASSLIDDHSADLIAFDGLLCDDPAWPRRA